MAVMGREYRRRLIAQVVGLALGLLPGARLVFALSLSNTKPVIEVSLRPGEVVQGSIELVSLQDTPIQVQAYLEDWRYVAAGDGNKTFTPPETLPRSCPGWVRFFPQEFELPGRGRVVVDYTISVPQDQPLDGGYYAVLFFEGAIGEAPPLVITEGPGAVVQFAARLGSLFFVETQGTVRREARLHSVAVVGPGASSGSVMLEASLANEGNVTLKCRGSFHLMGPANVVVGRGELPERYIWPGDEAPLAAEWAGTLEPGDYTVVLTYTCGEELIIVEEARLPVR